MSKYLDDLSPEERERMLRPSEGLLKLQAFKAKHRQRRPNASMDEVVGEFQRAENAKLPTHLRD